MASTACLAVTIYALSLIHIYELQLAALNRLLTEGVDSLFFPPTEKWAFVSSTIVREIYLHHGDVKELVPEAVYLALKARRE